MNPYIERWRQHLADEEAWYRLTSYEYGVAIQAADKLLADDLIDALERHDLGEEARAARDFYLEDKLGDLVQPDRQLALFEGEERVGHVDGTLISIYQSYGRLMAKRWRGGTYVIEPGLGYAVGYIAGDELRLVGGRRLRIVHVSTRVNGVEVQAIQG